MLKRLSKFNTIICRRLAFLSLSFLLLGVSFQNCVAGFESIQEESNSPSAIDSEDSSNESNNSTRNDSNITASQSFIFKSEFRENKADNSGIQVCDYPDLENCQTDADGKSKGRMVFQTSPLKNGSSVQIMKFELIMNSYLQNNLGGHIAIGLRGRITKNEKNDPIAINGRGFIIGYVGGHPSNVGHVSCQVRHGEIESYHGDISIQNSSFGANHVFPESCTDSIFEDGFVYKIEIYVSRDRKIGYRILSQDSKLIHSFLMQDPTDYIDLNFNEWFIAHVFESRAVNSKNEWNFITKNIQFSETENSIETFFSERIHRFQLGSNTLADNSLVDSAQIKLQDLTLGNFRSVRRQIYGCANPASAVDSGSACQNSKDFRSISFNGDPSYVKVGERLKIVGTSFDAFPANTYKLILRLNPLDNQNQNSVRIEVKKN